MAANVFATPGSLYLTPTSVTGTTGALISGIEEQALTFVAQAELRLRRTGLGANAGVRVRRGRWEGGRLFVPLRQQDTNGLKILFSHLTTDGSAMRPTGGTAALQFAKMPTFAMIVRPKLSSEKYLYSPNWQLSDASIQLLNHHETAAQLDDAMLELIAGRPTNATGPAWEFASAATIASVYGLAENP